jgi:hypothetical protein
MTAETPNVMMGTETLLRLAKLIRAQIRPLVAIHPPQ